MNYYNENDPKTAAWLRELIRGGHIPNGYVDERSITEVKSHELTNYTQCHFFAGIGGWSLALRLAGWPDDRPVWTGSCPCQPFSVAGNQRGKADERHLWPAFFDLIRERHPEFVFGEQVEAAIGKGWLDGIQADLEGENYALGSAVLGAHSVGAPQIRQRLYWVANNRSGGPKMENEHGGCGASSGRIGKAGFTGSNGNSGRLGNTRCASNELGGRSGDLGHSTNQEQSKAQQRQRGGDAFGHSGANCWVGNTHNKGSQGRECCAGSAGELPAGTHGAWSDYDILPFRDGKSRRVESGTFPLAYGVPGRVGLLRGYGNAIVPQVAAEFIQAYLETLRPDGRSDVLMDDPMF